MHRRRAWVLAGSLFGLLPACSGTIDGDPVVEGDDGGTGGDSAPETPPAATVCDGTKDFDECGTDGKSLVHCKAGVATTELCADGCSDLGVGVDRCLSDAVDPCFNDPDGDHCGAAIGGDPTKLYHCKGKKTASTDTCPSGCWDGPGIGGDKCASDGVEPCFNDPDGTYCGSAIGGDPSKLYHCKDKKTASTETCSGGCQHNPPGTPDACAGVLSCGNVQWWNSSINYGPYKSSGSGWWDTDIRASSGTKIQLRHASRLDKEGVYGWGWMPEFTDQVTGRRFRFLHLRPSDKYTTTLGKIYPAGTVVGLSGGDTADTGLPTYSTGAHLCVQTIDLYRDVFPSGTDPCK